MDSPQQLVRPCYALRMAISIPKLGSRIRFMLYMGREADGVISSDSENDGRREVARRITENSGLVTSILEPSRHLGVIEKQP